MKSFIFGILIFSIVFIFGLLFVHQFNANNDPDQIAVCHEVIKQDYNRGEESEKGKNCLKQTLPEWYQTYWQQQDFFGNPRPDEYGARMAEAEIFPYTVSRPITAKKLQEAFNEVDDTSLSTRQKAKIKGRMLKNTIQFSKVKNPQIDPSEINQVSEVLILENDH